MSFFIIGMPRSRTAWLSNFMTYDGIYCHHEGLNNCNSIQEYEDKIGNDGDSSTGLMLVDIKSLFPDRKLLLIDAPIERTIEFTKETYGVVNLDYIHYMKERLDALDGMRVKLEDISSRTKEIWEYLTDKEYDDKRTKLLSTLFVETPVELMNEKAAMRLFNELQKA